MIRLSNVGYRINGHDILSDINLEIRGGEFVWLVGPSGAGKSTLLKLIHMEQRAVRGDVEVASYSAKRLQPKELPYFRRKVSMIFQDFKLLADRDVYDNIAFALYATGCRRKYIKKQVFQILASVGLSHKRYSKIHELSGGEQQRIAIARALVHEPFVLLADEPTGNLDNDATEDIINLLKRINLKGMTILMATHKDDLVKNMGGRTIYMKDGKILI